MGGEGDLLLMEQREKDDLVGVTFTSEEAEAARQWVQDRAVQSEIVATPAKLYLPVYSSMTIVDPGDTVWFNPSSDKPNAFIVERA